jgi:hypothetical protein
MNRKWPYISTDVFIKWPTQHFLKHKTSGTLFLLLDGRRVHCRSPWLLQAAVENNITVIWLPSLCTHALQPLDKCSFGPVKSVSKNAAAAWLKQNPQRIITRYHMARLIGFSWNNAASRGVDVSAFESTGVFLCTASECLNISSPFLIPTKL